MCTYCLIPSTVDGNFECSQFGAILNNAAMSIPCQVFASIDEYISVEYIPRVGLLG